MPSEMEIRCKEWQQLNSGMVSRSFPFFSWISTTLSGNLIFVFSNSIYMEDKELIQIALGLSLPWFVKSINLDTSKK